MLAGCAAIRTNTGRLSPQFSVRRLGLTLRHVCHSSSSERATTLLCADSSTATSRLRTGHSSVAPLTTSAINRSEKKNEGNQRSNFDTCPSQLKDQQPEVRESKTYDGGQLSNSTEPIHPQLFKGVETVKHEPRWNSIQQIGSEKSEASAKRNAGSHVKGFPETSTQEWDSMRINPNEGSDLHNGKRTFPRASYLNPQSASADGGRRRLSRNQKLSRAMEHGDAHSDSSTKAPTTDSLFAHLRNAKGTRTTPQPRLVYAKNPKLDEEMVRDKEPSFYRFIRSASVEDIERKLDHTAHHKPNIMGIEFMLKELIQVRHVQPEARHYEALILANCEARHGSASALYSILSEMEQEKLGIRPSTLSAVLKVLSIHPDPHLLTSILQTQSSHWTPPSISDTTHAIIALIRLNQFELALSHLETLITNSPPPDNYLRSPVPNYLYTTLLYRLSSPAVSDHTAVLQLLYLLTDHNLPLSPICLSYLLDSAAQSLHLDLTLYLWRTHVDFDYLIPSNGLCRNALLTAARNGNAELAIKAGRVLELRGNQDLHRSGGIGFGLEEMEMVREAFVGEMQKEREKEGGGGEEDEVVVRKGKWRKKGKGKYKIDLTVISKLEKRIVELQKGEG